MFRRSICLVSLVLALATVQSALGIVGPGNDDCQNAYSVGNVSDLSFDTTLATFDGPGHYLDSPNIWYCYTAPCTGGATVSLAGSSFDTMLAVYDGCTCDPAADDLIEGNDDADLQQSEVNFLVKAGQKYLIEVGGFSDSAKGPGIMNITCTPGGQPSNDECSYAEQVYNGDSVDFDTTYATIDGPELCLTSPNVWYIYSATYTGDLTVSATSLGSFDVRVAVYDGSDCSPSSSSMIGCDDDFGTEPDARVTFQAIAGHEYLIEVGGYNSEEIGKGTLTINSGTTPPSSSDNCQNAKPIGNVTNLSFDTQDATFDGMGVCMSSPNIWYCYTALCNGDVTVSLLGSSFDTMLAVYDDCSCYPTSGRLIECNDDFDSNYQSQVTFTAIAGNQYLIEVGGYGSETGKGVLTVSCEGPVASEKPDLGDAPDSSNNFSTTMTAYSSPSSVTAHYPTVFNDGSGFGPYGPIHVNAKAEAYLGKKISGEAEADTGLDDDGTNNLRPLIDSADRDESDDGVIFPVALPNCDWTTFDYTVTVAKPGTDLWVNVWLDFNRDGDWDDTINCTTGPAPEWAVQNQFLFNLPAGLNQLTTPAFRSSNPKSGPEGIWMRITLSEQPWKGGSNPGLLGNGGSGPLTRYQIGETEDYLFTPETSDASDCPLCQDVNGDGSIDVDDLAALTAQWLANCP